MVHNPLVRPCFFGGVALGGGVPLNSRDHKIGGLIDPYKVNQPMDPEKKSLNFIFPTKYVIPKSLKFSHWLSGKVNQPMVETLFKHWPPTIQFQTYLHH